MTNIEKRRTIKESAEKEQDLPQMGEWYWFKDDDETWLGCVVHVGSNYAEMNGVNRCVVRVHFDKWDGCCEAAVGAEAHIKEQILSRQERVRSLMEEVRDLTARLAITPMQALPSGHETQALVRHTGEQPVEEYKSALVQAKKETLPDLFKKIRQENESLASWMKAGLLPLTAQSEALYGVIDKVDSRIFNVELYAGLVEHVEQITDGEPAPIGEKVRLIQHRAYMDEECLAQYQTGGMDFSSLREFDVWLAKQENVDRILPFPRCVIAFKVRRHSKERNAYTLKAYFQIQEAYRLDTLTCLYIRNGERLYRLNTGIEFEEKLFPDLDKDQLSHRLWADVSYGGSVNKLVTQGEYEALLKREEEEEEAHRKSPHKMLSPYRESNRLAEFTPDSVYYDDIAKHIAGEIEKHNRLVLVLQGLLDRSPVFHPHPPWQIWTAEGFSAGLELIYDVSRGLSSGPPPDFETYRARLNRSLKVGSVTVGQEYAWEIRSAERTNARRDNDWRDNGSYRPERERPPGDPGPGTLARVVSRRGKKCTFKWLRGSRSYRWDAKSGIPTSIEVPSSCLLNVDAYKSGDFKMFFNDPRTRGDYLQWAPLLLEAEEYWAGNREIGESIY